MKVRIEALANLFPGLRISHRIVYITVLSIGLYLVAAAIGWIGMQTSSASLKSVYEDRAVPMQDLAQIDANIREDALNLLFAFEGAPGRPAAGLMDDSTSTLTNAVRDNGKRFEGLWQKYLALPHGPEEKKLSDDFYAKHQAWQAKLNATLTDIEARKLNNAEVVTGFLYAVREERQAALDAMKALIAYQAQVARDEYEIAESRYRLSRSLLLLFLVAGGLLVGLPAVLTLRYITRSLRQAGEAASAIAAGDLTRKIEISSKDEIGELLGRLSAMREGLHQLIASILGNVAQLRQQAADLSQAAGASAQAIQQQSHAASAMAADMEKLSASIDHVGDNAREAHAVSQNSSSQALEGGRIIHQTAGEMEHVASAVNETAITLRELESFSSQISGIVQVINEIADQTNLLALNAAIEAARAGEQGRGFAVVADEVRKLAERTGASTQEIGTMIAKIQEGTEQAVREMEAGVRQVTDGVKLAHQAGDSVTAIRGSAERAALVVADISLALNEQTAAAREVARTVETIARSTEDNNATVQKTATLAQQLAGLSEQLASLAGRFRIS
ncbi:MAG: methyl-accepting chemotaxis protein [Rhodocyclaceae bacterium]|nr:MAG: methyl-accepting chemotaxis protein [Rhodocyclaceae bacterium]